MSSFNQKSHELFEKAEQAQWSLECDEKLLELMQNIATKVENRTTSIKSNINSMKLGLDETKIKLSNLTRINSLKNTNYCESLISDDHFEDSKTEETKQQPVKLSPQIAIDNGLKLMDTCFEKHRVNHNPSDNRSETSIVYRPIDKFMNVLPHLIGSEKWSENWHVGLLDNDILSHSGSEHFVESTDSINVPSVPLQSNIDGNSFAQNSSLMASQESLTKSLGTISDQMVVNRPTGGLFDDIQEENNRFNFTTPNVPSTSSHIFRPQAEQRKIVNLFDDEPPYLESSPLVKKKAVNLFDDDNESEESFPTVPIKDNNSIKHQPPVDIFNDNEFDAFIKHIETKEDDPHSENEIIKGNEQKPKTIEKTIKQNFMKITEDAIKNVHLKKADSMTKTSTEIEKETNEVSPNDETKAVPLNPSKDESKINSLSKRITNLFDDEEESDDFFEEIMKKKGVNKTIEPITNVKEETKKNKLSNLFDDEQENVNNFDDIFKTKQKTFVKKSSSLFDDDNDDDEEVSPPIIQKEKLKPIKKSTNLFNDGDDDVSDILGMKFEVPKTQENVETTEILSTNLESTKQTEIQGKNEKVSEKTETKNAEVVEKINTNEIRDELPEQIKTPKNVQSSRDEDKNFISEILKRDELKTYEDSLNQNSIESFSSEIQKYNLGNSEKSDVVPANIISSTLPFLSDIPPDDDDNWDMEDNYDDLETKPVDRNIFNQVSSNYSSIPLFSDIPPDDDDFMITKPPPIPEPNFESDGEDIPDDSTSKQCEGKINEVEKSKEDFDEIDRSVKSVNIKDKLEIFNKKTEEFTSPKKLLPGKLNTNLKINVDALMPGARLPTKKSNEMLEEIESNEAPKSSEIQKDSNNNANLLNNDLTKSRARIQVKRRPSTRRGRQANYQRTLTYATPEDKAMIKPLDSKSSVEISTKQTTKNLSSSIFDDGNDENNKSPKWVENSEKKLNHPVKSSQSVITTNKISVFYDDEEDTRMMMEEEKLKAKNKLENISKAAGLFDDLNNDFFEDVSAPVTKISHVTTSAEPDSDDDLFGAMIKSVEPKMTDIPKEKSPKIIQNQKKSLFDDDDELFGNSSKKLSSAMIKKSSKLFDSDDDDEASGSIIFTKPSKNSLFGDDSDDDLFSSKPKSNTSAPANKSSSSTKSTSIVKKKASHVIDDPLKDLLND
ncbi:CLUMA_CG015095, isoform A [Clunio marinus]|uniref:CLUMA_CG015095, isoform A n=1 Tax=Clunio marinus TaxID=568069 RepID=A0A1J1IUL9_9DIPT|nr:CLUMA_CG015095, isoform A [Clunio marinus]